MASNLAREIISLVSPASVSVSDTDTEGVYVKGFASVQTVDRKGDIVPPEEFNLAKYLTSPTVLVNHEFWIDDQGNQVSVGKTEEVFAATLVDIQDPEFYGIQNGSGEVVNKFPKSAAPDLSPGDRGLFAVILVTEPDVVEKVNSGELSAFSWRGLTSAEFAGTSARPIRILRDIDLFEISLVNIPANSDATFVIGKADGTEEVSGPFFVYAVELSKDVFASTEDAEKYLQSRSLETNQLKENDKTFCSFQCAEVDVKNLIRVGMEKGVSVLAGPPTKKYIDSWVAEEVRVEDLDFKSVSTPKVSSMSKITIEAEDITVSTNQEAKGAVTASKNKSDIDLSKVDSGMSPQMPLRKDVIKREDGSEITVDEIVSSAAKAVLEQLNPSITSLVDAVKALSQSQAETANKEPAPAPALVAEAKSEAKVETSVEEIKTEEAKEAESLVVEDTILDQLTKSIFMIAEHVEKLSDKVESLDSVEDMVKGLRNAIPGQEDRKEVLEKSFKSDPNSVFDNHHVFSGRFLGN